MDLQEYLALGLVAACVAGLVFRRRRRGAGGSCGDCAGRDASPPSTEHVLHFRPRPGRDPSATRGTRGN